MKVLLIKTAAIFTFIILLSGCAPYYVYKNQFNPVEKLAQQIELQIAEPELEPAFLGIMVQSLKSSEILYQHNAKKLMMPASNEKIPTSAAALIKLSPDFKYETKVYAIGSVVDSVLHGDLVIIGSGDPTIGYRFCEVKDTCLIFKSWANALKEKGISSIDGNLIGVDDIFDDELIGYGWSFNDLVYSYAAQISGLMLNENYAKITVTADSSTKEAKITIFPDYGYLNVTYDLKIFNDNEEANLFFQRIEGTNDIIIKGNLKLGGNYTEDVSIHNPTRYFLKGLRYELNQLGIPINGKDIDSDDLSDSLVVKDEQLIYTHYSPPFSEVIKILMKESQNLYAESLVKLLGYYFGKRGSFKEGEKIVKQVLKKFGIDEKSYQYRDGSGVCRYNYISPYQIVKMLRGMYYHPYGEVFRNSLPIAGVDGTIGYRMKCTVAEGNVNAKTGTISNVRCLSGYAVTKDDEVLAFSIMANNFLCTTNVIMDLQDRICMLLTSFTRKLNE